MGRERRGCWKRGTCGSGSEENPEGAELDWLKDGGRCGVRWPGRSIWDWADLVADGVRRKRPSWN